LLQWKLDSLIKSNVGNKKSRSNVAEFVFRYASGKEKLAQKKTAVVLFDATVGKRKAATV
jgi:hypothetical protein